MSLAFNSNLQFAIILSLDINRITILLAHNLYLLGCIIR